MKNGAEILIPMEKISNRLRWQSEGESKKGSPKLPFLLIFKFYKPNRADLAMPLF